MELVKQDWYEELLGECRAILSESRFVVSMEVLKGKWELGRTVATGERAEYGKKIVEQLAKDLDISGQTLWKCIQFYKKFPLGDFQEVLPKLETGTKTPTWHLVCQHILPKQKEGEVSEECQHSNLLCLKCRKKFNKNEL